MVAIVPILFVYLISFLFGFITQRRLLNKNVRLAGLENKYYPKGYVKPCNFVANDYNWRVEVPRFAYISAFVIYSYPILFIIASIVVILNWYNYDIVFNVTIYGVLLVPALNILWMDIWGEIYRKGNQTKTNHNRKIMGLPSTLKLSKKSKNRHRKRH